MKVSCARRFRKQHLLTIVCIKGFRSVRVQHFLTALKSVSSTLTYLEVEVKNDIELWADQLILACPNLVTLRLYDPPHTHLSPVTLQTWPTLTTLSIHNKSKNKITTQEIIGIWERFPSLKELDIYPCEDLESAFIVSEYTQLLNRLRLALFGPRIHLYYQHEEHSSEGVGLKSFLIVTDTVNWNERIAEDIGSIIKQYNKTLVHLDWISDRSRGSETIEHLQYPRLKKLGVSSSGWQITRNAPLLEELKLSYTVISEHPPVLDMIPPHLKKLELDLRRAPQGFDMSLIQRYFNRIAQTVQLKELVMLFNYAHPIKNKLGVVYRLAHLECLMIRHFMNWEEDEINNFLDGLVQACPRLTRLELQLMSPPATSSVNILKRLEHFQQFEFRVKKDSQDDAFWHAICTFPQLKRITLYPDYDVVDRHIKHVRRQRPDLNIIIRENPTGDGD